MDILFQDKANKKHYKFILCNKMVDSDLVKTPSLTVRQAQDLLLRAQPISPQNWSSLWQQLGCPGGFRGASDKVILEQLESLVNHRKVLIQQCAADTKGINVGSLKHHAFGRVSRGASGSRSGTNNSVTNISPKDKPLNSTVTESGGSGIRCDEKNALSSDQPPKAAQTSVKECAVEGEPISMISGEELLQLTDAELPGPMAFAWKRTYRSSNPNDIGMGFGWTHTGCESINIAEFVATYCDSEGREIPFQMPRVGQRSKYIPERFTLDYISENCFVLKKTGEWDKVFVRENKYLRTFKLTQLRHPYYNPITAKGFAIHFHYNDKGLLVKIQGNWGKSLQLKRNVFGQLSCILLKNDISGNSKKLVEYEYSPEADLILHRNAVNAEEKYQYKNHLITCRTLKTGFNFYFEWDANDHTARCIRNWGDRNIYHYKFRWDADNRCSFATDSRGFTKEYHYNEYGQIVKEVDNEGGIHLTDYNRGRKTAYTNPEGHRTEYFYDAENNPAGHKDALGHRLSISYFNGVATTITDKDNTQWRRKYNAQGLLATLIDPCNRETHYRYDECGMLSLVVDAQGHKTQYHWSDCGELKSVTDTDGHRRVLTYNEWGQIVASEIIAFTALGEQSFGQTQFYYNATGFIEKTILVDGGVKNYTYNSNDQLISYSDPKGRITEFKYDGLSQVVERIDPEGQRLKYEYDGERNLIAIYNENRDKYRFFYDGNERLIKEIGFDGRIQEYKYDRAGSLLEQIDAGSVKTHYERDAIGQLTRKTSTVGYDKIMTRYAYDPKGRIIEAYNKDQYLDFKYNAIGYVINEHHSDLNDKMQRIQASMVDIRYDIGLAGECREISLPDGQKITYQFDSNNRFTDIHFNKNNITHIQRDLIGREAIRKQGDLVTSFEYDPSGRLKRQLSFNQSQKKQGPIHREYQYNTFGDLENLLNGVEATRFTYDLTHRLKKAEGYLSEIFDFDPASNLLGIEEDRSKGEAEGNRLLLQGDRHYYYDERGNLIQEKRGKGGKLQTKFEYNSENQLVRTIKDGQITDYKYDPLGRRIEKSDSFGVTKYLWAGDRLTQEERNHIKKTYVYEPESFKPVALIQDDVIYHYHLDHIGTPQELTNDQGRVVWKARFKTYGNVVYQEVEEIENNLRFQGQYFDQETGLHYNRHRYYNPNTGQFTTQDPIGLLGGLNSYQYAPNPVAWVDPLGLACKELPKSVIDDVNLLGAGAFKEAFIIDSGSVFLTPKRVVSHNQPHSIEQLKQEAFLLNYLDSNFNLPTLNMKNLGYINMPDGSVVQGLIADRKLFNGKDVDSIRRGKNPQGLTLADVYDTITPETLSELKKMEEIITKEKIVIKDFQLMFGKDGRPVIADPLDAYAGKDADDDGFRRTKDELRSNIVMVENILNKR